MARENIKATNTMRNNINAAGPKIQGAVKAQYILKELHARSGMTQQALLSRCINYCFDNDPMFDSYRSDINEGWLVAEATAKL